MQKMVCSMEIRTEHFTGLTSLEIPKSNLNSFLKKCLNTARKYRLNTTVRGKMLQTVIINHFLFPTIREGNLFVFPTLQGKDWVVF